MSPPTWWCDRWAEGPSAFKLAKSLPHNRVEIPRDWAVLSAYERFEGSGTRGNDAVRTHGRYPRVRGGAA